MNENHFLLDFRFEAENNYVVTINVVFMRNVDRYCVRMGRLNVGTVTGKGGSLADMMETRNVGLLCVY